MLTTCFIIVKLDSIERLNNVLSVIYYIKNNCVCDIVLLEFSNIRSTILESQLPQSINYFFIEDNDPILHRTYYINQMVIKTTTPFVAIWDADIVIAPAQIKEALELLKKGEADFVYPYEKFLDTTPIIRNLFIEDGKIETLEQNQKKMKEMYAPEPLGGVFFANRDAYIKSGIENEDFYGWGMEDGERFYRWQRLSYKIKRVPGPLFHLSHGRGLNSRFHNPDQSLFKQKETLRAKRMVENENCLSASNYNKHNPDF